MTSTSKTDSGSTYDADGAPVKGGGTYGELGANPTNVYVAQFPSTWTKHELYEIFCPYGPISEIRVLTKQADMGRSRGIAFVHYQRAESAAAAIANVNWSKPKGASHSILVKLANKSKNISARGPSSDMRLTFYASDSFEFVSRATLLVSGFPVTWQGDSLQQVFGQFGRVLNIQFVAASSIDPSTGMPPTSASATVSFESPESAVQAVAVLDGSPATADQSHMLSVKYNVIPSTGLPHDLNAQFLHQMESSTNVYVTRFPNHWTVNELAFVFSPYGEPSECRVTTKQGQHIKNRGVGFVHYSDPMSATLAVAKLHESTPAGCDAPMSVQFAKVHANLHDHILGRGRAGIVAAGANAAATSEASNAASGGAARIAAKAAAAALAASAAAQLKPQMGGAAGAPMMGFPPRQPAAAPGFGMPAARPMPSPYAPQMAAGAGMPLMQPPRGLGAPGRYPSVNPALAYNPASAGQPPAMAAANPYAPHMASPAVVKSPYAPPQAGGAFPLSQRGRGRGRGGMRGGRVAPGAAAAAGGFSSTSQFAGGPASSGYAAPLGSGRGGGSGRFGPAPRGRGRGRGASRFRPY